MAKIFLKKAAQRMRARSFFACSAIERNSIRTVFSRVDWPNSEREIQALLASVSPSFARVLPENLALEFGALPCIEQGERLSIAVSEQPSDSALTRIERATGRVVQAHVVAAHLLAPEIARCYGSVDPRSGSPFEDREERTIARYLDRLFERAMLERASDIHIDGIQEATRVRFRIDGRLRVVDTLEAPFAARLTSRIKLLGGMDISERRLPQDGRLAFAFERRSIDMRIASVPSESGERLALRLFDREGLEVRLDDLGFTTRLSEALHRALTTVGGFFVVCGPTGSGKSTTLYALLRELYCDERHLCSVEDPVEKIMPGVTQVPINVRSGLTFAHALRALLRQDPDVVMIGEIRDSETAATALGAALSGQLVMSTVHGADIKRGVDRLCELGLSRPMILQALTGMMTQRLVRRLCVHCRRVASVDASEAAAFGFTPGTRIYRAIGCDRCAGSGYRGRVVIADLVIFDSEADDERRERFIQSAERRSLLDDARAHCEAGDTTIEEIAGLFISSHSALA